MIKISKDTSCYLIILFILLLSMMGFLTGNAIMKWDIIDIYLPWKYFITETIQMGEWPLWNPSQNGGFSQMGDPGTWYPISWILGLIKRYNILTIHVEYLLHLYIAGVGFYKVARSQSMSYYSSVLVAILYMLSGFFIGNAQHIGWLISMAWFPHIMSRLNHLFQKPSLFSGAILGLYLFLALTGGYPGLFIIIAYVVLGYSLIKLFREDRMKRLSIIKFGLISIAIFLLMSSVVFYSSLDMSSHITRGKALEHGNNNWGLFTGSLYPKALVTLFYPFAAAYNNPDLWGSDFSMVNCYFGFIPLIMSIIGMSFRKIKPILFVLGGVLFFMMSMGNTFPLRAWLSVFPLMNFFRFSAVFRIFAIICFILAFGQIFDLIFKRNSDLRFLKRWISGFTLLFFAVTLLSGLKMDVDVLKQFWELGLAGSTKIDGFWTRVFIQSCFQLFCLLLLTLGIWFKRSLFKFLLSFVILLDIIVATQLNFYATVATQLNVDKTEECIKSMPIGTVNINLDQPISDFADDVLSPRIPYLWRALAGFYKQPTLDGHSPYTFYSTLDAIDNNLYYAFENESFLFVCDSIDCDGVTIEASNKQSSNIQLQDYGVNRFTAEVICSKPQYLIVQQNIYPHWNAVVDGRQQEIITINKTFMGIAIEEGSHVVEFSFEPPFIYLFIGISMFTLLVVLIFVFFKIDRKQQYFIAILLFIILSLIFLNQYYRRIMPFNSVQNLTSEYLKTHDEDASVLIISDEEYFEDDKLKYLTDLEEIKAFVKGNKKSHLLIISVDQNSPIDLESLITDSYPIVVANKFGLGYRSLEVRKRCKEDILFQTQNDFERDVEFWSSQLTTIDSSSGYGSQVAKFLPEVVYGSTFEVTLADIVDEPLDLHVDLMRKSRKETDAFLVISIDRAGKNIFWESFPLDEKSTDIESWYNIHEKIRVDHFQADDRLKVYIWNKNANEFSIDHVTINAYRLSES